MADTILKSLSLRNWNSVRQATLEFPERGLVLVRGINAASKGKLASIGSGKTSLGEALSRALFGLRGRYAHIGNYSTRSEGNSYVCLDSVHRGKPLKIEMGFKCDELNPMGEGLRFTYDGNEVNRSRLEETRADLLKVLTVPTDLAGWTVHLDGDLLRFGDLSENKAVQLLMAALMQPRWNFYHKSANEKALDLKRQQVNDRQNAETAKRTANEAETELQIARTHLAEAKAAYAEEAQELKTNLATVARQIEEIAKRLGTNKTKLVEIKKEIDRLIAATAEKTKQLEINVNESRDLKDQWAAELSRLRSAEATAKANWQHAKARLQEAREAPDKCPTCGKPWDRADTAIEEKTKAETKTKTAYEAVIKAVQGANESLVICHQILNEAEAALEAARAE